MPTQSPHAPAVWHRAVSERIGTAEVCIPGI